MKVFSNHGMFRPMGKLADRIKQVRKSAGLTQEEFAKALGEIDGKKVTRGAVGNWELGGGISRSSLSAISATFGVSLDWLEKDVDDPQLPSRAAQTTEPLTTPKSSTPVLQKLSGNAETLPHNARMGASVSGFSRVPIRGQAMGGKDGALTFNTDLNMGDILAPPVLMGVPDAYAVYVVGDSMLERFRHGEAVYVHPYLPYRKDDDVVFQISMGEHEAPHGWIKRFVSMDSRTLKVRQLNPKKILTFPRSRVIAIHKIVMSGPV